MSAEVRSCVCCCLLCGFGGNGGVVELCAGNVAGFWIYLSLCGAAIAGSCGTVLFIQNNQTGGEIW